MSAQPMRPVLRYHGGKWRLAPWVIEHLPPHRTYVEPFGGAASVLMLKPRSYAEVYNDLDGEVVNVFRVLRDEDAANRLWKLLTLTPFARDEFNLAYEHSDDPLEQARRTILKSFAGFGSASIHDPAPAGMRTRASTWKAPTGFRCNSSRSGTTPAYDWAHYPWQIDAFVERLRGVVIENRDAADVVRQHDGPETLHYVDPPYVHETRSARRGERGKGYAFEMTDGDHAALAAVLRGLEGMVVLSGYPCDLYDRELYPDWRRIARQHLADGAKRRTEVLWFNPAAAAALQPTLFDGGEA